MHAWQTTDNCSKLDQLPYSGQAVRRPAWLFPYSETLPNFSFSGYFCVQEHPSRSGLPAHCQEAARRLREEVRTPHHHLHNGLQCNNDLDQHQTMITSIIIRFLLQEVQEPILWRAWGVRGVEGRGAVPGQNLEACSSLRSLLQWEVCSLESWRGVLHILESWEAAPKSVDVQILISCCHIHIVMQVKDHPKRSEPSIGLIERKPSWIYLIPCAFISSPVGAISTFH